MTATFRKRGTPTKASEPSEPARAEARLREIVRAEVQIEELERVRRDLLSTLDDLKANGAKATCSLCRHVIGKRHFPHLQLRVLDVLDDTDAQLRHLHDDLAVLQRAPLMPTLVRYGPLLPAGRAEFTDDDAEEAAHW